MTRALLDPADRMRIEAAVHEAERTTGGEIVVCVVGACDEYGSVGWRLGVVLAALALLVSGVYSPAATHAQIFALQAGALALGHLLGRIRPIRRFLLPEDLLETRVRERAVRAFGEHGLARTAARTGILIFVAVLERRVVVLGDEGIDRALGAGESWSEVVALATAGLGQSRAAEGILAAVRRCGEILSAHLPIKPGDTNELPNRVVIEDT